jgi:hypothetical protein
VLDLTAHPELRELMAADLVLVRPDQHVAWRGAASGDAAAVLEHVIRAAVGEPLPAAVS